MANRYILQIKPNENLKDIAKLFGNVENITVDSVLDELHQIIVSVSGSKANVARLFGYGAIASITQEETVSINSFKEGV